MEKLTKRQVALISIAVGELMERLRGQGDEYDEADIALLEGADEIITRKLNK